MLDILLNQVNGDDETRMGVPPVVWQYPLHVLWTIRELVIPEEVTGSGDYAFYGYSNSTNVTIPNSVIDIGFAAFYDCESLTDIAISANVISIAEFAFDACRSLADIYYGGREEQGSDISIRDNNSP